MSISANFIEWCRFRGYTPRASVYLESDNEVLKHKEARVIRMVSSDKIAGHRADRQRYVVEVFENCTFHYPLGPKPKNKQQLLSAMISDVMTMERKAQ